MVQDKSFWSRAFDISNYTLLMLFALATVIPFISIISGSFATVEELMAHKFLLFPTQFSLEAYRYIFSTGAIMQSMWNSIYITVAGTIVNLIFTILMAYPLAHNNLRGRKWMMLMVIFTMLFGGGMIPTFLIVKMTGLLNSVWSVIIPSAINAFNLIVLKNFFQQVPMELEESAKIDGCNYVAILIKIILPLSLPAIATFALFYAVGHWNSYFHAVLYINDNKKWPVQVLLRQVVLLSSGGAGDTGSIGDNIVIPPQTIKMATITISTIPILFVYPFLQKHFTKGVLLGSVKG